MCAARVTCHDDIRAAPAATRTCCHRSRSIRAATAATPSRTYRDTTSTARRNAACSSCGAHCGAHCGARDGARRLYKAALADACDPRSWTICFRLMAEQMGRIVGHRLRQGRSTQTGGKKGASPAGKKVNDAEDMQPAMPPHLCGPVRYGRQKIEPGRTPRLLPRVSYTRACSPFHSYLDEGPTAQVRADTAETSAYSTGRRQQCTDCTATKGHRHESVETNSTCHLHSDEAPKARVRVAWQHALDWLRRGAEGTSPID